MNFKDFEKQQYLALETFRKNGQGVKTPVWFAHDGDALMVWTEASSGKAKRIRNNEKVQIVPSNASGEPSGEWIEAQARPDNSKETMKRVVKLFKKKYGIMFNVFAVMGKIRKAKYMTIKIWR